MIAAEVVNDGHYHHYDGHDNNEICGEQDLFEDPAPSLQTNMIIGR